MNRSATSLLFVLLLISICSYAQVYPVQGSLQITPPYSPYLTDYTLPGTQKLMLHLISNDITISDRQIKFRLTIDGVGITIRTKPAFIPTSHTLNGGGAPTLLYGEDLAEYFNPNNLDFAGISRHEYEKTGKLPEGVYRFSIDVYDYHRNARLSNNAMTVVWIVLNDPPLLNLPRNNTKVSIIDPTNIAFTWTPRHTASPNAAFSTEYIFKLVEIWPVTRNPYDAFLTQAPLYETILTQSQLIYGPAEPALLPGRKYAWQVQARDEEGRDIFKNQGKSEVYVFQFGDQLGVPENLRKEGGNDVTLTIRWEPAITGEMPDQYNIRYKQVSGDTWYETLSNQRWVTLVGLKPNTEYDVQVRAKSDKTYGEYTTPLRLKTAEKSNVDFSCGQPPVVSAPKNLTPLTNLLPGDVITNDDWRVVVTEVTKAPNGTFSGKGMMAVKMFNGASIDVTFSGGIDSDYEMMLGGVIESIYDQGSEMGLVVDEMHKIGERRKELDKIKNDTIAVPIVITGIIDSVYFDKDKKEIVVVDAEGKKTTYAQPVNASTKEPMPAQLTDAAGNTVVVAKDGKVTKGTSTAGTGQTVSAKGNPIKNRIVVLILEKFETEIGAWLRINGKGGEEDEDVYLAEELPLCFPKDAEVLKLIKEKTIPYYKEKPDELVTKIEQSQEKKKLFDKIVKLFSNADKVALENLNDEDRTASENNVCEAIFESKETSNADITEKIKARIKELYEASGKQVMAFLYCKDCHEPITALSDKVVKGVETIMVRNSQKICLGLLFEVVDGKVLTKPLKKIVDTQTKDIVGLQVILPTLGSSSQTFGLYNLAKDYASCTDYLDKNFFNDHDFCKEEPSEAFYNQLIDAFSRCINDAASKLSDDDVVDKSIVQAAKETLDKPLDTQRFKVIFSANGKSKEVGEQSKPDLTIKYTKGSDGTWQVKAEYSKEYVEKLAASKYFSKYGDLTRILSSLTDAVDELMLKAQIRFCDAGNLSPNCVSEQLRTLQVLSLNLENLANDGTIHKAMWHGADTKRTLLPEDAKWSPIAGGVVDEVVEEATAIPMLVKTLWEVYSDAEKRAAIAQLFTQSGFSKAISTSFASLINSDGDQLQYKGSRAMVMLAFFYYAAAESAAKSLDDAMKQASELSNRLEHSPALRKYMADVASMEKKGIPQTKQLKELLDKVSVADLEQVVKRVEPEKVKDLLDDLAKNDALRDAIARKPALTEGWSVLAENPILRKKTQNLETLSKWIEGGVDKNKLIDGIAKSDSKQNLIEGLANAKSRLHAQVLIKDYENIPGVAKGRYVKNSSNPIDKLPMPKDWSNTVDLPESEIRNFTGKIEPLELKSGTTIYRVSPAGKENGAYWTQKKPEKLDEVIGGTAVQPEWNNFAYIHEYTVPAGMNIKTWKGKAARQQLSDTSPSNYHLPGGSEQLFINYIERQDPNFQSIIKTSIIEW